MFLQKYSISDMLHSIASVVHDLVYYSEPAC